MDTPLYKTAPSTNRTPDPFYLSSLDANAERLPAPIVDQVSRIQSYILFEEGRLNGEAPALSLSGVSIS